MVPCLVNTGNHLLKGLISICQLKKLELEESHIHSSLYHCMTLMSSTAVRSPSFSVCKINKSLLLRCIYVGYVIVSFDIFRISQNLDDLKEDMLSNCSMFYFRLSKNWRRQWLLGYCGSLCYLSSRSWGFHPLQVQKASKLNQ